MRKTLLLCLSAIALSMLSLVADAAKPVNTLDGGFFEHDTGIAIRGYDPVAYFLDGKPEPGSDAYTTSWMGATWKFSSAAHLQQFKADPAKYAPQYGGYCAYGVAKDNLVKIEPDEWTIIDGKLYLNYDADVQKKWKQDVPGYIKQANEKFPVLLKK